MMWPNATMTTVDAPALRVVDRWRSGRIVFTTTTLYRMCVTGDGKYAFVGNVPNVVVREQTWSCEEFPTRREAKEYLQLMDVTRRGW